MVIDYNQYSNLEMIISLTAVRTYYVFNILIYSCCVSIYNFLCISLICQSPFLLFTTNDIYVIMALDLSIFTLLPSPPSLFVTPPLFYHQRSSLYLPSIMTSIFNNHNHQLPLPQSIVFHPTSISLFNNNHHCLS
uniref:Uncharacterized protein n=1 Tax=Octopus bimaculoides TaxID=37653 RepID=A0A0L8G557_OCTBM